MDSGRTSDSRGAARRGSSRWQPCAPSEALLSFRSRNLRKEPLKLPNIHIEYPAWVEAAVDWERVYNTPEERMRLAIELARQNVAERTGGPFGAAIFDARSGTLCGVGMNLVVANHNAVLHGEVVAIMMAQKLAGHYSLKVPDSERELYSSCDPCAMCLGAVLWSGVTRVYTAASREDALALHFDEGPVFPQSYQYLQQRGITFSPGLLREEAREVMERYRRTGGRIYNA